MPVLNCCGPSVTLIQSKCQQPLQFATQRRSQGAGATRGHAVHAYPASHRPLASRCQSHFRLRASPDGASEVQTTDFRKIADLIASAPLQDEQSQQLSTLATALDIPLATAKQMAFKRRGLLSMGPQEIRGKVTLLADTLEVSYDTAKAMATIQPGLLFDTLKQAETLALGIRAICYELKAPKDEVIDLILKNQSVLHGREMHLSVADIAHLAMLREPRGRIAE